MSRQVTLTNVDGTETYGTAMVQTDAGGEPEVLLVEIYQGLQVFLFCRRPSDGSPDVYVETVYEKAVLGT